MWHREYMASCPISGTPSLHGHDKARSDCPVVIPRRVGGVWEWAGLELAGCSSLPLHHNPSVAPKSIGSYLRKRLPTMRWRRLAMLQRASERTTAA